MLDWRQLRDITLDDGELIREVLAALLDDTSKQIALLDRAIRRRPCGSHTIAKVPAPTSAQMP